MNLDNELAKTLADRPIRGVRYNVVRRPLSGGKGDIRRHKPSKKNPHGESAEAFYRRLAGIIAADPASYFMRWEVTVTPDDVARFRRECLDPILENLCWWYDQVVYTGDSPAKHAAGLFHRYGVPPLNWRHPFGVWNVLDSGGEADLDEYLATGSTLGLTRTDALFEELK